VISKTLDENGYLSGRDCAQCAFCHEGAGSPEARTPGVNVIKLFSFVADDEAK
jgi:hypothetical protein